jgi:molecular chaperone GrpE
MTDDDPQPSSEQQDVPADDARFEVKWSKKESSTSSPGVTTLDSSGEVNVAALRQELEAEKQRADELRDRWQRSAADLANLRKRTEQDKSDLEKFATMLLVQELLPVLDNFQRALDTIPQNLRMLTWIYGVALIERELQAILERRGLVPIETMGKAFNTQFHEALSERETSDAEPGTIVQEFQRGYTMHGYVIRPALVEVAKAPTLPADAEAARSDTTSLEEEAGTDGTGA